MNRINRFVRLTLQAIELYTSGKRSDAMFDELLAALQRFKENKRGSNDASPSA